MALAQTPAAPPSPAWHGGRAMMQRMQQRRMEQLTVLLDLTAAQQRQVNTILSAEHERMWQAAQQAMRQIRDAHRAVRKDTLAKLSTVLSPQQMKKFKVLMPGPDMMSHGMMMHGMMMHGMMMPGPGPAQP
jgi:hypothetical protein